MKKSKQITKEWYLGFDIGTGSVGWCASDSEYNILTKNGKLQCGSRLFSEAKTAVGRREKRSLRRRMARRKLRIDLLQQVFSNEIDDKFFLGLNESNFYKDDKIDTHYKYTLFNDDNFTDVDFHNKFKTIYHLRYWLTENDTNDPRLLYLACHNILKHRGHFLFNNMKAINPNVNFSEIIDEINELLVSTDVVSEDEVDCGLFNDVNISINIKEVLKDKNKTSLVWDDIEKLLKNKNSDNRLTSVFKIIRGNKISTELKKLWPDCKEIIEENEKELKDFKFVEATDKYERDIKLVESFLNDEQITFILACKKFYDAVIFTSILSDSATLSEAKVKLYEENHADLINFKYIVKKYAKDSYNLIFRFAFGNKNMNSYSNYMGKNLTNNKRVKSYSDKGLNPTEKKNSIVQISCDSETFCKNAKSLLESIIKDNSNLGDDLSIVNSLLEKANSNKLLVKLRSSENSYIPNQIMEYELRLILEKQSNNFPFLNEIDPIYNLSNKDKIIKLLTFRIPYSVGPLSDLHLSEDNKSFAWIARTTPHSHVSINPWNFEQEVDMYESGQRFIQRMLSNCTYCKSKKVLPKESIMYQKFEVFNELNNLKIDGNRIDQELKLFLFKEMCKVGGCNFTSKKNIKDFLVSNGKINKNSSVGKENEEDTDRKFNSSMSSLRSFKKILKKEGSELTIDEMEMCEQIILWHTVFGEEKKSVRERIRKEYKASMLEDNDDLVEQLTRLSFSKWGRFSKEFLSEVYTYNISMGRPSTSIIDELELTTHNHMELLNDDKNYVPTFLKKVDDLNKIDKESLSNKLTYDVVEDLYCSVPVKRSIWQTMKIFEELVRINKCLPKKVYIEVTRGSDNNKKRKLSESRRELLIKQLDNAKEICSDYDALMDELKCRSDAEMRSDKVYLYFTQLGCCLYTGKKMDLNTVLNNSDVFDIDHIYPQSKIKDDSFNNIVLVDKYANQNKSDGMISPEIREKWSPMWCKLKDKGLITNEKYNRLISTVGLTYEIVSGFINRQLVETNQAAKSVAELIKNYSRESNKIEVVYSKARFVTDFRERFELTKCREINNLHHAHDAYLNIVVGNVWYELFTSKFWCKELFKIKSEERSLEKLFDKNFVNDDGKCIWDAKHYLPKIKSYLFDNKKYLNKFLVTYMLEENEESKFYDETVFRKGKGDFRIHECSTHDWSLNKQGGYKYVYSSYSSAIEFVQNNEKQVKLFPVPNLLKNKSNLLKEMCDFYDIPYNFSTKFKKPKILINSILEFDGVRYKLRSQDKENIKTDLLVEWQPKEDVIKMLKNIIKYNRLVGDKKIDLISDKLVETDEPLDCYLRKKLKYKYEKVQITKENNVIILNELLTHLAKPFYREYAFYKKIDSQEKIEVLKNLFFKLSTYKQVQQLIQLMNFLTTGGTLSNCEPLEKIKIQDCSECVNIIKGIKFVKNETCMHLISDSKYDNYDKFYIIEQSVTGLFERRTEIFSKSKDK